MQPTPCITLRYAIDILYEIKNVAKIAELYTEIKEIYKKFKTNKTQIFLLQKFLSGIFIVATMATRRTCCLTRMTLMKLVALNLAAALSDERKKDATRLRNFRTSEI